MEIRIENKKQEDSEVMENEVSKVHVSKGSSAPVLDDEVGGDEAHEECRVHDMEGKHGSEDDSGGNVNTQTHRANESVRNENERTQNGGGSAVCEIEACTANAFPAKIAQRRVKSPHAEPP